MHNVFQQFNERAVDNELKTLNPYVDSRMTVKEDLNQSLVIGPNAKEFPNLTSRVMVVDD